ncbi:MAG: 50S ribosomal protein L1 [Nitrososphaerota archaeon]|nr:50S ribosomal protein L1 [Nitrososphaerota archaeon]
MSKSTITLAGLIDKAKESSPKRNFSQSMDLYLVLDRRKVNKSSVNINEMVGLPHPFLNSSDVVFIAAGDIAMNAKKLGAKVIEAEELDRYGTNKKAAKKIARSTYSFVADVTMMAKVGKALGPVLAPRGKMPSPIPQNANVETIYRRMLSNTRMKAKNQFVVPVKIGTEAMASKDLLDNAKAVVDALDKKLPGGKRSISSVIVKLTMGKPVKAKAAEVL